MALERVQKIMSNAGFCSRRKAEELIADGKVMVNSSKIKLGDKADIAKDTILVNGKPIMVEEKKYYLFYKPKNVLSSLHDPFGKSTIAEFTENLPVRVFPVGRLDYDAEGLIILTNDGDFANKIMHPRYETLKTYEAELRDRLRDEQFAKLKGTVRLEDGTVKIESARRIHENLIEITIHEGRHKIVKRIFKELGFYVKRLKRTMIGPFKIGRLRPGEINEISKELVVGLMNVKAKPKPIPKVATPSIPKSLSFPNAPGIRTDKAPKTEYKKNGKERESFQKTNSNYSKDKPRTQSKDKLPREQTQSQERTYKKKFTKRSTDSQGMRQRKKSSGNQRYNSRPRSSR